MLGNFTRPDLDGWMKKIRNFSCGDINYSATNYVI